MTHKWYKVAFIATNGNEMITVAVSEPFAVKAEAEDVCNKFNSIENKFFVVEIENMNHEILK